MNKPQLQDRVDSDGNIASHSCVSGTLCLDWMDIGVCADDGCSECKALEKLYPDLVWDPTKPPEWFYGANGVKYYWPDHLNADGSAKKGVPVKPLVSYLE